jgi:predicted  nucleic acid-binding Zn-ribbon protein
MWKKIQERTLPFIIALSALSVSVSAAFYSVSGLSKLFAGASLEVIIMASSLEVAKLVIASLLYQYRKTLPKLLKYYLTIAAVVLILITSMGIYGFLSAAYQETASKAGNIEAQITLLETKRDNYTEQLAGYSQEKESLNQSISDLRAGLAGNKIQYKDRETGQIITTTSSSNRRSFERQLDQALERQDVLNERIDGINQSIFDLETEIVEVQTSDELAGELGPLKYLSGLTGIPMDRIINYLLLVIIFVFDPLAIALVVAANYAFERLKPKENIYGEKFIDGELYEEGEDRKEEPNEALIKAAERYKETLKKDDWTVVDEEEFRDLNRDGIIDEDESNILKVLEETGRQYKVLYRDGNIRWVDKPDESNRKVY